MGLVASIFSALFGGNVVDDGKPDPATGLTPKEKEAIRASWALLAQKPDIKEHGVEFFVLLFKEYPYMQPSFDAFKGMDAATLRKDRTMYSHSLTVMYTIGNLVDNLDDVDELVLLVNKIAHNHLARGIGFSWFQDLATMFPKFLEARAGEAATPFVKQSWSKFLGVMNSVVKSLEGEGQKTT